MKLLIQLPPPHKPLPPSQKLNFLTGLVFLHVVTLFAGNDLGLHNQTRPSSPTPIISSHKVNKNILR